MCKLWGNPIIILYKHTETSKSDKNDQKIYFSFTKYMSCGETDTLVLRTREKYWFSTAIHDIYLAFILNSIKTLYICKP